MITLSVYCNNNFEELLMINPKKSLLGLGRIGHPIKNRDKMVTLEHNYRTIDFQDDIIKEIAQAINGFNLRAFPSLDKLYEKMFDWLGIPLIISLFKHN